MKPQIVAAVASRLVGIPYREGGNLPDAADCWGIVSLAYGEMGIPLQLHPMLRLGCFKPVAEPAPGDVLFLRRDEAMHVGLYVGDDWVLHGVWPRSCAVTLRTFAARGDSLEVMRWIP